jgi:hypothetical protein
MPLDTLKHVRAMQETALALEAEARANGRYSKDCSRVNDAITRGHKSGVALLWDAAGRLEVVDLNGGAKHVQVTDEGEHVSIEHNFEGLHNPGREEKRRDETSKIVEEASAPYEQASGENFKRSVARSHERSKETEGRFEPVNMAGDKARVSAELKAKQARNAADAKAFTRSQFERNERIAAQMRAASDKIWNKGA